MKSMIQRFKRIRIERTGMTLVELLVVVSITGILAVTMGSLWMHQAQHQAKMRLQGQINRTAQAVQMDLQNPANIVTSGKVETP